jgi:hypothetical protein
MKITKADFKTFEKECHYWLKFFNLGDWDVDILHEDIDNIGECACNLPQKHCIIRLAHEWDFYAKSTEQIKLIAFHEVVELLLFELRIKAMSRIIGEDDVDTAIHTVIQRLSN